MKQRGTTLREPSSVDEVKPLTCNKTRYNAGGLFIFVPCRGTLRDLDLTSPVPMSARVFPSRPCVSGKRLHNL
jgi:hypothetical protein